MAEVTYLLGAGASAERIPVVNQMALNLSEVISDFETTISRQIRDSFQIGSKTIDVKTAFDQVIEDLSWIQTACEEHFSIDTYAKKLYLTDEDKLDKLKLILSFYFTYLQINNLPDKRYDNFWASILSNERHLPKKIKILSWNYDFQVEQSFMNMSSNSFLSTAENRLNKLNLGMPNDRFNPSDFGLIKLNGSAKVYSHKNVNAMYLCDANKKSTSIELLKVMIENYLEQVNLSRLLNKLYFAWETDVRNDFSSSVFPFLQKTEVLAIIGYSFPFFNRKIDADLFRWMPNLSKIYI
ncbi:hypothetical protein EON73_05365, partial [bacterium]